MKLKQIRVDGYKNLINCVVNLGDFNVVVGPNNSGKSNLLEAIRMLFLFCYGGEEIRKMAFRGFSLMRSPDTSICHLTRHENKPLSIGITFETTYNKKVWVVDYDISVQRSRKTDEHAKYIAEVLQAKEPSKTGKPKKYISRNADKLKVIGKKERNIAKNNSSLLAIKSIYPNFETLPPEIGSFVEGITDFAITDIFAISPDGLREAMGSEKGFEDLRVSSFDLLLAIDQIHEHEKQYEIFKESVCDILDLDDFKFIYRDVPVPSGDNKDAEKLKRARYCLLKRVGDKLAHIKEYSEGTLLVIAILSVLFSKRLLGPILCLEELENCLHPAALERLVRLLQDHAHTQPVLITTHSPYLLNCVNPEDVNVAIVDETGAAHFEKVRNTKQLRDYLKSGFMSFGDMLASNFEDVLGK